MSKTQFQNTWKLDFPWIQEGPRKGYAICLLCGKDNIYYASMGRSSISSHAKGKKHILNEKNSVKSVPLKSFFTSGVSTEKPVQAHSSSSASVGVLPQTAGPSTSYSSLDSISKQTEIPQSDNLMLSKKEAWWKIKDEVTQSEVLWCLQTVMCHNSLRNAASSVDLFKVMFKDSSIANDMRLGKDKISYYITHGIAPYLKQELISSINKSDHFVVCFDESLNRFAQKQQMDIVIRFWDEKAKVVRSNYFNSVFLNKCTSVDLLNALKEGLINLNFNKIIQVSMDGPNVNVKLLRMLKVEIEETSQRKLLDIGSCGLHVLNVAFKNGIKKTNWNLMDYFRSTYYLFKDSPSRRGTYVNITNSTRFPMKFCQVRWLENSKVAKTALDTLPSMKQFVKYVKDNKIKPILSSSSFKKVCSALEDKLLMPKIAFFESVSEELEPFLKEFQTESPFAPFLYSSLVLLLKKFMDRIVKEDVIVNKAIQDVELTEQNLKNIKDIDIGYAARAALRKCCGVKEIDVMSFRRDCRNCLKALVEKILEKHSIKSPLTKSLTFLDPHKIAFKQKETIKNMESTMDILVTSNVVVASRAQNADYQFRRLITLDQNQVLMKNFSREQKLDEFWMLLLGDNQDFKDLKSIVTLLLPLSHGNALVERGFSINKDIISENLEEESLKAQRIVYDNVNQSGGVKNFNINKKLLHYVRNSNSLRNEALSKKKLTTVNEEKAKAEKRKADMKAKELEENKKKILLESQKAVAALEEQIKELKKV